MAISLDRLTAFHQRAVNVRNDRMEVIAGNLANANTPGYKARDINFQEAMRSATYGQQHNLTRTNEKHLSASSSALPREIQFRETNQPDTGDGNNVEVQKERNMFLDNGLRYQASLQFLDGKFKGFKKALTGGQS
ncbi:flagellar basal body rod protein FlgB [Paraneptunicella aestuarii]|uniref:flagellar basal body rod protein FlgB n=1 Tax=Paraneptunicella aestuarii TaxID=2831148 RepID=UPI001E3F6F94|nr:flagellar basal body rod protein FlgB [Paraneptunicella aestuarii]UAA39473.1 flagellar basal body rod protein FlgB [Paraneptunicella aestuarii]